MVLYLLNVISEINKIMFVRILFVVIIQNKIIVSGVSGNEIMLEKLHSCNLLYVMVEE